MALIGRSGKSSATSSQVDGPNPDLKETDRIIPNNDNAATDLDVVGLAHIQDTFTTNTAIAPERYSEAYGGLMLYVEGIPVTVTYYHTNLPPIDIRTGSADIQPMGHSVHKDFTKILHMEMKLQDNIRPDFVTEDNSFDITGEAVMYPGFEPNIGDEFLLDMGNGKIGEFKVNDKTRMSYRQGACYKISFEILNFLDDTILTRLESGVRETFIFDKRSYPGEGDWTFLTQDKFVTLTTLEKVRRDIIARYMKHFYSRDWNSFMRPDGMYDPYVCEFLKKKLEYKEIKRYPLQLFRRLEDYEYSFWSLFTSEYPDLRFISPRCSSEYLKADALAIDHNPLVNRHYLALTDEDATNCPFYVMSENFYIGAGDKLTDVEKIVYTYLFDRKIDPAKVLEVVQNNRHMDLVDMFYQFPIYLELIDVSIGTLRGVVKK